MSEKANKLFYQNKDFRDLNNKWARKLKKSGFEDIEQPADYKSGVPDGQLKSWSSKYFTSPSRFDPVRFECREEYYRLAGQFLHEYTFNNDTEKSMWQLHCEGQTTLSILEILKAKKIMFYSGKKTNRRNVVETIRRLTNEMLGRLKP